MKSLVSALYPLNRTIVGPDTDKALKIIGAALPPELCYRIDGTPSGTECWTWTVPKGWVCDYAVLRVENGCGIRTVVDVANNPLHVVNYSQSVDERLTWDELAPHLYVSEENPDAIPWRFDGYYQPAWGFCLPKSQYDTLPRNAVYHAVIKSRFTAGTLNAGVGLLSPSGKPDAGELVLCAHVDHPRQANDDASGCAVLVEVAKRLVETPLPEDALDVRFLFCAERIGSIAWLHQNQWLIPHMAGGIFVEMAGTNGPIRLVGTPYLGQYPYQWTQPIDRIALKVLGKDTTFRTITTRDGTITERTYFPFGDAPSNDEGVFNGPGLNIPMISLSRWPYSQYHTSADEPSIISEAALEEMADVVEAIVRIRATDYVPVRRFTGPLFLSRYGLWVDWREDFALNRAIDAITHLLEGELSVFEIAEKVRLDYWVVRGWIDKLVTNGLAARRD